MRVQTIFIACARASAHQVHPLVDDLRGLGYVVYLDRDVPGGREWWAHVLRSIADANAFIYALTSATLDSEVCTVELDIARDLHKPVLPVELEAGIKDASLPRAIGQIQRIGYSQPNRAALAQLFAGIEGLSASKPVALSEPPAPPRGLHASMEDQLGVDDLDLARQDVILDQLEQHLRSGFTLAELDRDVQRLRARPEIARRSTIRLDGLRSKAGSATSWPSTDDLRSKPLAPVSLPRLRSAFISYSRHDDVAMTHVVNELETLGLDVWRDTLLPAGVLWWDQVLEQIRRADAFFLATSPASLGSAACISELRYARSLGKPVLSLELADVGRRSARGDLGSVASCPFAPDSKDGTRALARLLRQMVPVALPDLLPPPPPIPASYVFDVRAKVRLARELTGAEQDEILRSLRAYADEGIDHDDLRPLIVAFSRRPELLSRVEGEVRAIAHFVGLDPATLFGDGANRGPGDQHGAAGNDDERPTADRSGADAPADEPVKERTKARRNNNTTTPPPKGAKQASTKKTASKAAGTPRPRTKAATPVPQKAARSTSTGAKAGGGLFGLLVVVFFALRIGLPMWGSMAESCADGEYYDEYDGWFEHAVCAVFVNHSSS